MKPDRLEEIRKRADWFRDTTNDQEQERIAVYLADQDVPDLIAEVSRLSTLLKEREWIPVSERLPETDGVYLVYLAGGLKGHAYYVNAMWCFNGQRENRVTHWQPLPKPPGEQGDG